MIVWMVEDPDDMSFYRLIWDEKFIPQLYEEHKGWIEYSAGHAFSDDKRIKSFVNQKRDVLIAELP
jgi:hypothetical protein